MSERERETIENTSAVAAVPVRKKKLSSAAKFGILIAAVVVVGGVFEWLSVSPEKPKKKTASYEGQIAVGNKLSLPGEDWAANGETLVIAMQVGCDYCEEMAPFYKELTDRLAGRKDLRIVAVLPQPLDESQDFLKGAGLDIADVKQAELKSISVKGTPTVIVVDQTGTVTDTWLGVMSADQKSALMTRLKVNPLKVAM